MDSCLVVQNVHDTFRPFYYLLKVTGLAPFRLNSQPSNDRKELYYAFGYSASFICVYSYAIYGYLFTTNTGHLYISKIVAVMENGYMFCEFMVTNVAIIFGLVLRNRVLEIFVQLAEIDEQLNVLRQPIEHNRQHRLLTVLCSIVLGSFLFLLLVTISTVTSRLESFATPALDVAALAISSFCFLLQIVQFTVMVLLVLSRYQAINELFRMYFPTSPSAVGNPSEFAICSEKEQINVLKQIKILHDKLNDVVELVNYCFSVQITFCVGLCFVIGVVCSFGLFRAFIYRNELFYMGVLNFIWYMYYLFFVLFFIAVGSKITREGKRIGILVHKAINCSSSSAVINELNLFSQQLLHRSPVITCGLFVYDWTLWYTMIGATATYLIILIQFDVSFPNLVNVNATAVYRGST
ncbi:putative gustatory receptor 2a isoform X5 [Anopheles merus]|uniref:putative gustatory receptor 2a isoform X5 n=1 Tax=Anopheles merus TaxID=30066 RepID=UPI001BE4542C|nr:putative gustatory receptor 2a isoform X5 [Anopheles merus]